MAKERLPAKRVSSNTFLEYNNQQLATATAYEQKVETGYTWVYLTRSYTIYNDCNMIYCNMPNTTMHTFNDDSHFG